MTIRRTVSRRNFLRGVALAPVAGVAGVALALPSAPFIEEEEEVIIFMPTEMCETTQWTDHMTFEATGCDLDLSKAWPYFVTNS